ncbi:hypothetical protein JQN72_17350 [Phycicoccus sp. CSK15P-2]|uniref:hypothetical protein n=1 Tax=Phycicoccus sp. CSK15P-2 TaxID=2807627 RepID=UPI0019512A72|nr:hypothetical protein [Phycicoccus sp. CSK15P-2]MBM6406012.1 hypothetical protein [Phycicoccus sp. CSK15P-2]
MPDPTPSLTGHHRLVMGTRTPTIDPGLAARVHDPMWMLARQWQLGEFVGEDAGTPISTEVSATVAPITRYHAEGTLAPGTSVTGRPWKFFEPLEPLVESQPVHRRADPTANVGVTTGLRLRRMLRAAGLESYLDAVTAAFPLPPVDPGDPLVDAAALRRLRLAGGRVPDGRAVYAFAAPAAADPEAAWSWPEGVVADPADDAGLRACLTGWVDWYDTHYVEPEPGQDAWDPGRQEYRFAVATHDGDEEESVFVADSYHGGRLDWDALSAAAAGVSLGADWRDVPLSTINLTRVSETMIPTPLTYPGMPAARWWELEDAAVDWGGLEAGTNDLLRLLLVDYALTYAGDWYVVPLDIEPGTFTRITSLVVTDVFGVRTTVPTALTEDWRMYVPTGRDDGLLLLPAVYEFEEGEPVEDVRILRDETANLAWGIEHLVEGAGGEPVDRRLGAGPTAAPEPDTATGGPGTLRYRLATGVPPNWFPFLPVRDADGAGLLERGALPADPGNEPVVPLGRVLAPGGAPLRLSDEEVPRSGLRVTRSHQFAIGARGEYLWVGRRRVAAEHGDARSGMRFDTAEAGGDQP